MLLINCLHEVRDQPVHDLFLILAGAAFGHYPEHVCGGYQPKMSVDMYQKKLSSSELI